MSVYPPHLWAIAIGISVFLMAGFAIFARWCVYSPAIAQKKLDRLSVGMSRDEVLAILGQPREAQSDEHHEQFWLYGPRWKRHLLVLEFTPDGKLVQFIHGVPKIKRTPKPAAEP